MSITAASEIDLTSMTMLGIWAVASLVALGLMTAFGTFQRRADETLQRLFARDSIWPLVWNVLIAITVYFAASMMVFTAIATTQENPGSKPEDLLVGGNLVAMAVVMSSAAFLSLMAGVGIFIPDGFTRVGLDRSPLQGIKYGAAMILAAMPILLLTMAAAELSYKAAGYKHEQAHELLKAMDPNNPLVRMGAVFAAVVVAPLAEELLFRGHLQPVIRRLLSRWFAMREPRYARPAAAPTPYVVPVYSGALPPPLPPVVPTAYPAVPPALPLASQFPALPLGYAVQPLAPPAAPPAKPFLPSFLAIMITSVVFSVIHPAWSWPPIFVLSVALGFSYERTGNLWVPIVMHACFNGLMTSIYLSQLP
jgi:membrane protease YdiL (CAAX protease family)